MVSKQGNDALPTGIFQSQGMPPQTIEPIFTGNDAMPQASMGQAAPPQMSNPAMEQNNTPITGMGVPQAGSSSQQAEHSKTSGSSGSSKDSSKDSKKSEKKKSESKTKKSGAASIGMIAGILGCVLCLIAA